MEWVGGRGELRSGDIQLNDSHSLAELKLSKFHVLQTHTRDIPQIPLHALVPPLSHLPPFAPLVWIISEEFIF